MSELHRLRDALESWRRSHDLADLACVIPGGWGSIKADLSQWLEILAALLSQLPSVAPIPITSDQLGTQLQLSRHVYSLLLSLGNVGPTHPCHLEFARLLVRNMEAIMTHLIIVVQHSGKISLEGDSGKESLGTARDPLFFAIYIIRHLATWDRGRGKSSIILNAFCDSRGAARLMTLVWSLNSVTRCTSRPGSPPNLLRVGEVEDLDCNLVVGMSTYLNTPPGCRLFLQEWIRGCTNGTLYGERADAAQLLVTSFQSRFELLAIRIRAAPAFREERDLADFSTLSTAMRALGSKETMEAFPDLSAVMRRGRVARACMAVAQEITRVVARDQPAIPKRQSRGPGEFKDVPIPLMVFGLVEALRRLLFSPQTSYTRIQWWKDGIKMGALDIIVDALISLSHLPQGHYTEAGQHLCLKRELSELSAYTVAYPSILNATTQALKRVTGARAVQVLRVILNGDDIYMFKVVRDIAALKAREYRAFTKHLRRGDPHTIVCDNPKHVEAVHRRNLTGLPVMKTRICTGCHVQVYCSAECQMEDRDEKACRRFASRREVGQKRGLWYRASYRLWHLFQQGLFWEIAITSGASAVTVIDYTDWTLPVTLHRLHEYPYGNPPRVVVAKDYRVAFSASDLSPDVNRRVVEMIRGLRDELPWAPPGSQLRLIEGVYPWAADASARVHVMGKYLFTPSVSPDRKWDTELLSHVVRVLY